MIKENGLPPLYLLAHPRFGGGWRASARRKGAAFLRPTACGVGEGHEVARGGFADGTLPQEAIKMAPHIFKGRLPPFIIYNSPFTIHHLPFSAAPFHHYRGPPPAPLGSVSLDSQSSADSLRIQFPCHRKRWEASFGMGAVHLTPLTWPPFTVHIL